MATLGNTFMFAACNLGFIYESIGQIAWALSGGGYMLENAPSSGKAAVLREAETQECVQLVIDVGANALSEDVHNMLKAVIESARMSLQQERANVCLRQQSGKCTRALAEAR
eukprot:gene19569-26252_t